MTGTKGSHPRRTAVALAGVRFGLPAALLITGVALVVGAESDETTGMGVTLSGLAFLVLLLNVLMRAGIRSQRDREREENARRYFDRHGRWPPPGEP